MGCVVERAAQSANDGGCGRRGNWALRVSVSDGAEWSRVGEELRPREEEGDIWKGGREVAGRRVVVMVAVKRTVVTVVVLREDRLNG